ncbi:MAG: FG-GAP repeat domain-containing protein [Acidobacteriota bacterium]
MTRRELLLALAAPEPRLQLVDVTRAAGINFSHHTGAFGARYLPETLGPGCAFLDYDNDGWLDVLLVNGQDWPGHPRRKAGLQLYRNNRNGTFSDVPRAAGLDFSF